MPIPLRYAAMVLFAVTGCQPYGQATMISKKPDQKSIVKSAQKDYDYDGGVDPMPAVVPASAIENAGVPVSSEPQRLKIYMAHLRSAPDTNPYSQVLAKIDSDIGYAPLHIPAGISYLWRDKFAPDSGDKTWTLYIVPEDLANTDVKKWKRWKGEIEFSDLQMNPSAPHLVFVKSSKKNNVGIREEWITYGGCIEDSNCPAGHCGYGGLQ